MLFLDAAAVAPHSPWVDAAGVLAAAVASAAGQLITSRKRNTNMRATIATAVKEAVAEGFALVEARFDHKLDNTRAAVLGDVAQVRALVIGADGTNGIRSDVAELKDARDKDRNRRHDANNQIQEILGGLEVEQAAHGTRLGAIEKRVDGLEDRERQRPFPAYDRRSSGT